ncbi:MAG: MerR family transcriptional regulator [Pseudomonadota bacterium]
MVARAAAETGSRRGAKSAAAFRTISEVADELDVPQHVLRFWESRFTQIKPLKRAGGRRYYRPEDVELLRRIREFLYQHGYTIKGVQKLLRDGGRDGDGTDDALAGAAADPAARPRPAPGPAPAKRGALDRETIEAVVGELVALRDLLRARRR